MAVLRAALGAVALVGVAVAAVAPGERLPALALHTWDGAPLDVGTLRGRVVVIDFWATWCAPCAAALPALDALARRHPEVVVVAASIDDDPAAADRFVAAHLPAPALTLARDPGGRVMNGLGAPGMPTLVVVDREGVVRRVTAGWDAEHERALEREVAPPAP
jgi:thiol-disulfide isomerase/thioredoxin